jgi:hypothetical protein
MKNDNSSTAQKALENIKKDFAFLFQHGYEIQSVRDLPDDRRTPVWEVVLRKEDLFVRFYGEWGNILELSIRTNDPWRVEFVEIGKVVFDLTGDKFSPSLFGKMKSYATLLQKHLSKIETHFRGAPKKQ